MEFVSEIGAGVTDSLAYLGALATLGSRAAYYNFGRYAREREAV